MDDEWFQEEPYCPPCMDSGFIGRRHCPSCNPTRFQAWRDRCRWRVRSWWWRVRPPAGLSGEAPF